MAGIRKTYRMGEIDVPVLKGVDLSVGEGDWIALMGPSGSGKTTLMNLLGLLDTPTDGRYALRGEEVSARTDDELSLLRNRHIGFVFQTFNLLPQLTALGNVALSLGYGGMDSKDALRVASAQLERVGLSERMLHKPNALSGGEQQRVAIARALAGSPSLLLADEPTGNLDSRTGIGILALFEEIHAAGTTILMVTHDEDVASRAGRSVHLLDGKVVSG